MDADFPPSGYSPLLRDHLLAMRSAGGFVTIDYLDIRGRLGTTDALGMTINGRGPFKLGHREHLLLRILAHYAHDIAGAREAGRKAHPPFLQANSIAEIADRLTREGGLLAGLWKDPIFSDVYRSIGVVRGILGEASLNRNLIELPSRSVGYRLSTPPANISFDASPPFTAKFWADLFQSVLDGSVSGRE